MKNTDYFKQLIYLVDELKVPKDILAVKLGVSTRTIYCWMIGDTIPDYVQRLLIRQVYNGYLAKRNLKGKEVKKIN